MRRGVNPLKAVREVAEHAPLTICVVVHVPMLEGYWRESLDVLKVALNSIIENTIHPFGLMVFDNGSCPEVVEFLCDLRERKFIQYLILSDKNVGKAAAWNMLFGAAPGEYIVYADSDIYFHPGWLRKHQEILAAFPKVGMVTGVPVREKVGQFTKSTLEFSQNDPKVKLEKGDLIPPEILKEFRESLGRDPLDYTEGKMRGFQDIRVCRKEVCAFIGASHFQFMARKETIQSFLPLPTDRLIGRENVLDERLDKAGIINYLLQSVGSPI